MHFLAELRRRFAQALSPLVDDAAPYVAMIRPSQDAKFGDYQANCAMPLKNVLNRNPREIAAEIVSRLDVSDLCETPEIAGPGFINLRLREDRLLAETSTLADDLRLGVSRVAEPKRYVVDFSGPNIAKPMHVGHLRSTVIGDAICRILEFVGHTVIRDNHIGDWGTQFGMVIYGYRNFLDPERFQRNAVDELARLYRLVTQLAGAQNAAVELPNLRARLEEKLALASEAEERAKSAPPAEKKDAQRKAGKARDDVAAVKEEIAGGEKKIAAVAADASLAAMSAAHPRIADRAREETAKLHAGDAANRRLWEEFMPVCQAALDVMYDRLGIRFDMTLGESHFQPMLANVVDDLTQKAIARESDGAICVFLEGKKVPFLIRKSDGAFTYATTDLATLKYRADDLKADVVLYVVGAPQADHFEMLFETAAKWGYGRLDCRHISFGSVLDENRQMFRTRSGGTVGLEALVDEAVRRAREIVDANHAIKAEPELELLSQPEAPPPIHGRIDQGDIEESERQAIAEIVGIGGIKYADLHHNRDSDYVFSWDKMLAMTGDTGAYMQYAYARICGIFRKAGVDRESVRSSGAPIRFTQPSERALALQLHRMNEMLDDALADFRPSQVTSWLFTTSNVFSTFYNECPVKDEPDPAIRASRLRLCDLMGRALQTGLGLLGIEVREQM